MKFIKTLLLIVFFFIIFIILLNLITLSGREKCGCSLCLGRCALREKIPFECPPQLSYGINCNIFSCKYLLGRCFRFPKIIDLNYYLPSKIKENLHTSDYGKECTDSSQCESYCQAQGGKPGMKAKGICFGWTEFTGCIREIKNGIIQEPLCKW